VNVIILGVDGLRPDHLKRNGYLRDTVPNIEALMQDSVVFTEAYTVMARTYPSWMSILTGQLPINNGVRNNIISDLIPKTKTLTQGLQEKGWFTSFATDDSRFSFMQPDLGFDSILQPEVGAMNFALSATEPRFRMFHMFMHNPIGYKLAPVIRHNQALGKSYRPELYFEANIERLYEASQHDNFFFATHACFLHSPGDRNYPWSQMYGQHGYTRFNRLRYSKSGTKLVFSDPESDAPINVIAKQDQRIYDSGLDMADGMVKRVVDELKRSGMYDNTIIVLLSDHGENHWEKDLPYTYHGPNHGFNPYGDGQHHVLLTIRFPDGQFSGTEVTDTVRLIDLAPTLSEVLQLDLKDDFDGKSLIPLIQGEKEDEIREVYIETGMSEPNYWSDEHRDYSYNKIAERYWIQPDNNWVMVRDEFWPELLAGKDRVLQMGKWKLVWRPMKDNNHLVQLFNREEDAENRSDIAEQYPVHTAFLGMRLLKYLERDDEVYLGVDQWQQIVEEHDEPNWRD
jgi:arylsulfatase A-like enzyme